MFGSKHRRRRMLQYGLSMLLCLSQSLLAAGSANFDHDYLAWKAAQQQQDRRLQQGDRATAASPAQLDQASTGSAVVSGQPSPTVQQVAAVQVRLNSANLEQLQQLKGVGAKKAQAILQYRQQHGPFQSIEALKNVKGIGDILFEKNRNQLSL